MNVKTARSPAPRAAGKAFLLKELVVRDLKARFAGSALGPAWAVGTPLLWVLLYSFVFSVVLRIPLSGEPAGVTFPEFLLAAFVPWLAIAEGISRATTCLTDNAAMVKKMVFPRLLLPATVVLSAAVNELIALGLYAGYLAWMGRLSVAWLAGLVPALLVQVALTFGIGVIVSACHVFFRDTAQVVSLAIAMLGFVTPIFYPVAAVPPRFRWIPDVNPFTHLVELFRDVLLRHTYPAAGSAAYLVAVSAILCAGGVALFSRTEPHFADLL